MIRVDMTTDIRNYNPKVVNGWTASQAAHILAGTCVGGIIALLVPIPVIDIMQMWMIKIVIGVICAMPILFGAWFEEAGLTYEQFLAKLIYRKFIAPAFRRQTNVNPYYELYQKYKFIRKQKKQEIYLSKLSDTMLKQEEKRIKKKRIKYSTKKSLKMYR